MSETTARQLVKKGKLEGIRIGAQGEGPGDLRITVRSIRALINRE